MLQRYLVAPIYSGGFALLAASGVTAQTFPHKPIRIVTAEIGGGNDFQARLLAHGLAAGMGQQVIVENRAGSVAIHAGIVGKASPDGYTLLFYGPAFWLLPFMQDKPAYDPVTEFSAVTLAVSSPLVLVVYPSLAIKSVPELIALARSKPGELNYASAPTGSSAHLAAELFKSLTGVDIVRITFRGTGPALNALIAGQVPLMFSTAGGLVPHIKSNRLRALAVTSAQPSALFPGLPTVAASVPDYESTALAGMFAPKGTPAAIVNRLYGEIVRVLRIPDTKDRLFNAGVEVVGKSPEEFAAALKTEMFRMGKMIRTAGIRDE